MAYKLIGFILAIWHATQALADVNDLTRFSKTMPKAFVPTGQMPRLSDSMRVDPATAAVVAPENADAVAESRFPVHEALSSNQFGSTLHMGETLKTQNDELKESYQHLRARMHPMPQVDTKDAQDVFGFGSLMGLMASAGFVASIGVAAFRKYFVHRQQALQSTAVSETPLPQRSRPIVASADSPKPFTLADLKDEAKALNPVIGFFDPLGLSDQKFWRESNEATIGFLRHAEIKHGRVAMAGFVGYIVHENGIRFPWTAVGGLKDYNKVFTSDLPAPAVWDKMPFAAQHQIIFAIGLLEVWGETSWLLKQEGQAHYMRGGKPGYFPTFDQLVHPVPLNLYDPFKLNKEKSDEWKSKKLLAELNNGRLAMIGLMAFISEAKVPGSVPLLSGLIKPYDGQVMAPFKVFDTVKVLPGLFSRYHPAFFN